MLNIIWAGMILLAVVYGAATGRLSEVTNGALDSGGEAVSLCLTMAGIVALWMGLMEIAKQGGLILKMTRGINPFLSFLFPEIPVGHPAREYIATNIVTNILGLGWACTPAGLKAMEQLSLLEQQRGTSCGSDTACFGRASDEMCNFLILNISSLQLIPVNIIAYRSRYGSVKPASILVPAILATGISTLVAIIFCKCMSGRRYK